VRVSNTRSDIGGRSSFELRIYSTNGPIFLEQLQIFLNPWTYPLTSDVTAWVYTINGLVFVLDPSKQGLVVVPAGYAHGEFVSQCPSTVKLIDPMDNLAITAGASTDFSTLRGASITIIFTTEVAFPSDETITAVAIVAAPSSATVTLVLPLG
jgi:hypothetical protein